MNLYKRHCVYAPRITLVIQTLGGKDAVLVAGGVEVSLLDVHVVIFFVVGDSEEIKADFLILIQV